MFFVSAQNNRTIPSDTKQSNNNRPALPTLEKLKKIYKTIPVICVIL